MAFEYSEDLPKVGRTGEGYIDRERNARVYFTGGGMESAGYVLFYGDTQRRVDFGVTKPYEGGLYKTPYISVSGRHGIPEEDLPDIKELINDVYKIIIKEDRAPYWFEGNEYTFNNI